MTNDTMKDMLHGGVPLQPALSANLTTIVADNNSTSNQTSKSNVGATWAGDSGKVNINLDDLFGTKTPKSGPAPSMNQLKSNPSSPIHNNANIQGKQQPSAVLSPNTRQSLFNQPLVNNFAQMPSPTGFPSNNFINNNNSNLTSPINNMNMNVMSGFNHMGSQPNHQPFFQAQFK